MAPEDITIAITVYSRREFVKQAIESALSQSVPVRVMVVEDCSPDPELRSFILNEFGERIKYFKNPQRRGLFDNWNACIEHCRTAWLSILHDDDFLSGFFVAAMLKLAQQAPGRDLYFGQTVIVDQQGQPIEVCRAPPSFRSWEPISLEQMVESNPIAFPGQLFNTAAAKSVGGFRATSAYCGEWEMWTKLTARGGAAQAREVVGFFREHTGWDRGTTQTVRSGKARLAAIVQHKRGLALLPADRRRRFNRTEFQRRAPMSVMTLLELGDMLPRRLLRYYVGLLVRSASPNWLHASFKQVARLLGPAFVRMASKAWHLSGKK